MSDVRDLTAPLIEALLDSEGPILAVTGAGVSAASGLRTFRGREPGAIWRESDVSIATRRFFERDPAAHMSWYLDRFAALDTARPNPAHEALASIEAWAGERGVPFLLVTQNIDTLHEEAGSRRMIKVHGTGDRLRCSSDGCRLAAPAGSIDRGDVDLDPFREKPSADSLPRCPECDAPLRPHVLFFDEYYADHDDYRFGEVENAAREAAVMLFAGTSFAVGVTNLLLDAGTRLSTPMFSVDPAGDRVPEFAPVRVLAAPAETALPAIASALREAADALGP